MKDVINLSIINCKRIYREIERPKDMKRGGGMFIKNNKKECMKSLNVFYGI